MTPTALDKGKGRATTQQSPRQTRALPQLHSASSSSSSDVESDSDSDSDSSSESSEDEITQEYINSFLEKAKQNALARKQLSATAPPQEEEDVIRLEGESSEPYVFLNSHLHSRLTRYGCYRPLPPLDPGLLPASYIELGSSRKAGPSKVRDLDAEQAEKVTSTISAPEKPAPPTELTKDGKRLTKKQLKAVRLSITAISYKAMKLRYCLLTGEKFYCRQELV